MNKELMEQAGWIALAVAVGMASVAENLTTNELTTGLIIGAIYTASRTAMIWYTRHGK